MSETNQFDTFNEKFCKELARQVISDELRRTEVFQNLTPEQEQWFRQFAAPLLMREGLETGRAVATEVAGDFETLEERVGKEAEIFLDGMNRLNEELGR